MYVTFVSNCIYIYIYTYTNHKSQPNVGKYVPYIDQP